MCLHFICVQSDCVLIRLSSLFPFCRNLYNFKVRHETMVVITQAVKCRCKQVNSIYGSEIAYKRGAQAHWHLRNLLSFSQLNFPSGSPPSLAHCTFPAVNICHITWHPCRRLWHVPRYDLVDAKHQQQIHSQCIINAGQIAHCFWGNNSVCQR